MIKIVNEDIGFLYKQIEHKRLFMFGAGKRAQYLCKTYFLEEFLCGIIDNNADLHDKRIRLEKQQIPVFSIEKFTNFVKLEGVDNFVVIISPIYSAWTIIEQLDSINELDGLNCYLGRLVDDCVGTQTFRFTKGTPIIPKKIHYCWFGQNPIPEHLQKYMESWKRLCPDYEIIRWDESNYDVNKNRYMREAYEHKKWGFVPDYARLDIIYQEGGIYLDTDVELVSSLDKLLNDKMFCGFASGRLINLGLGFGAIKESGFIQELRDIYNKYTFIDSNGKENLTACSWYEHPIFEKYQFKIDGTHQKKNGVVIYPPEVLSPLGASMTASNFTSNTVSIHHSELSWITKQEKEEFIDFQNKIKNRL